jgi:hypothetical protein
MIEIQLPIPDGYAGNRIIKCLGDWDEPQIERMAKQYKRKPSDVNGYEMLKAHILSLPVGTEFTTFDVPYEFTNKVIATYFYRMEERKIIYRTGSIKAYGRPRITYRRTGE